MLDQIAVVYVLVATTSIFRLLHVERLRRAAGLETHELSLARWRLLLGFEGRTA
jgi:hypothetical protein